jgi:Na+-translocating ferredoxin:NAD+ oxidoreductase RNF subunit RnfB
MLYALVTLGGLGAVFGVGLYVASRVFHVTSDPRVEELTNALPGANCGGCGFPGCSGLATAIVHGSAPANACPVCSVCQLQDIGRIMGVEVQAGAKKVAVVHCAGRRVATKFAYSGPETCAASRLLLGGHKACPYGCLGLADCVRACSFGALRMEAGIPVVIEDRCTACGKCVAACPRSLIDLRTADKFVHVRCTSLDSGALVRKYCDVGCIGCKKCEKECPYDAIHVTDFLARIDYAKCTSCGACVKVCPMQTIADYRPARERRGAKEVA